MCKMAQLLLDLACASVFKLATLVFDNAPLVAKTIIDKQVQTDVEQASSDAAIDLNLQDASGHRATRCLCGCWRYGTLCPVVCLRGFGALKGLRPRTRAIQLACVIVFALLFWPYCMSTIQHFRYPWPHHAAFHASVQMPEHLLDTEATLNLRLQLLSYIDEHAICGAAAASIFQQVNYFLLRADNTRTCPSFAARCVDNDVVIEMFNPRIVDKPEHTGYTDRALQFARTRSLLCPHTCTREEMFTTPVTVVFTSRKHTLHTIDLRDEMAVCFQHHYKVAAGEWPCTQCLEENQA